ncbi:MAG TPA: (d)CMP kinase, partial [Anaerolineaceae bacterium]|nr:(d)CMP kinase [Anaerolineaceae bacterium]
MQANVTSGALPLTIAIDGPAAGGKTTVGAMLAKRLGYLCLDTGIMYRAVTWQALNEGLAPEDEPAVTLLAESIEIDVKPASKDDGRAFDVLIDSEDHTW